MGAKEIVQLVGAPYERRQMGTAEWWMYRDKDLHVVIIDHDTVANCVTQQEAMKIMTDALKQFDSLRKQPVTQ